MTNVVKINDHIAKAKQRLISQYRDKNNINAILEILTSRIQNMEDILYDFYGKRLDINIAQGEQLDRIGKLIDQDRLGYKDDFYRILIFSKIGINTSQGTVPDLIDIAEISTAIPTETRAIIRTREAFVGHSSMNAFRQNPKDDQGKLIIQVENDGDFLNTDLTGTVDGVRITDTFDLLISGKNWLRIGLAGNLNLPAVGQDHSFSIEKIHPQANIHFFNLGGGETAFGTDGYFPINLRAFLMDHLRDIVFAGIRLAYICFYLPGESSFGFGGNLSGSGFEKGELATQEVNSDEFRFFGDSPAYGMGDYGDPLLGGKIL